MNKKFDMICLYLSANKFIIQRNVLIKPEPFLSPFLSQFAKPRVSMADHLTEIHEQILIRLSVSDLIRCKSVCKSWLCLISDPRFIKAHLQRNYISDCENDELRDRRLAISVFPGFLKAYPFLLEFNESRILGSSDGLVCVFTYSDKLLVLNPSTREVKRVANPKIPGYDSMFWGFGYDSSTNDYKIVQGFDNDENCTYFEVFSLRFNVWKVVGEVNYAFITRNGVLCNEALHWVAYDSSSEKNVILSFHLSEEKFVEVPQPNDARYESHVGQHRSMRLGNMEDRLCAFRQELLPHDIWVMKEYNKKQSWERFLEYDREKKPDVVHCVKLLSNYMSNRWPLCHEMLWCDNWELLGAPTFVESLVSPHFQKKPKRKRRLRERDMQQESSTMKTPKVKPNNAVVAVHHANAGASDSANAYYC